MRTRELWGLVIGNMHLFAEGARFLTGLTNDSCLFLDNGKEVRRDTMK